MHRSRLPCDGTVDCGLSTVDWLAVLREPLELPLPGIHLVIRETEVVSDLVKQGELDLVDEFVSIVAVVEQRVSVEKDDIGRTLPYQPPRSSRGTPV